MLRLPDDWVWDSWIAQDGETYHLYYLKAPRALEDPTLRHARATIGHATSSDLMDWADLGTTLAPSADGWDDLALWTGSTVRGRRRQLADVLHRAEHRPRARPARPAHRRRGVRRPAHVARRHDAAGAVRRPALVQDARRGPGTASETWRDPFVFRDPDGDGWHMLVTARCKGAERYDDGVLAHARSGRPRVLGGAAAGVRRPVRLRADRGAAGARRRRAAGAGVHLPPRGAERARKAEHGLWCTWSVAGEPGGSLLGPWDFSRAVPFRAEPTLFAAPLVRQRDGGWALVGFRNQEPEGILSFEIIDPMPVHVVDGGLQAR